MDFSKAIGEDGFDGTTLHKNQGLQDKVVKKLVESMKTKHLPSYLTANRLIPLFKKKGLGIVKVEDIGTSLRLLRRLS